MTRTGISEMGLLLCCLMMLQCATGTQSLKPPADDRSFLLIGSILFQSSYLDYEAEVLRGSIEVAILGMTEEDGRVKKKGYWTMTDDDGYFFLDNMPPGQYALKGLMLTLSDGTRLIISSPLRYPGDLGFVLQDTEGIIFEGNHFPLKPQGRIMNLEHNYFTIDRTSKIGHAARPSTQGLELITGERIDLPPVPEYFIEAYPESAWLPLLKESFK